MKEHYFLNWEESANSAITEVGGKGQNLGSLNRYGFLVPAGGVLTARAYQDFLQHNGLAEFIHAAASIKAEEALESEKMLEGIRRKINGGRLSDAVRKELAEQLASMGLLDKSVAVRSSATAEDSARASFAGVHESFLNVRGLENVVHAIRGCYASLWTPRAVAYRRKMGLTDDDVATAVVIMELVPAVSAGVAFSCDPRTGRRDRIAISANFGLGESVVGGAVEPDEYTLDPRRILPEIIEKKIGSKSQFTKLKTTGGTELTITGEDDRKKQVLSDSSITELGLLTLRIYEALGINAACQDIEWANDGKKFFVLQARPVTGMPEPGFPEMAGQPVIWSNANLKDVMPQVPSTLSWNLLSCLLPRMMNAQLRATGYHVPSGLNWVRLYRGRGYFNLSALQWEFYDALGMLPGMLNEYMGGHQPEIKVSPGNPRGGWKGIGRILRGMVLMANILRIQISAKKLFDDMWKKSEEWNRLDFKDMDEQELISIISEMRKSSANFGPPYMILTSSAGYPFEMMAKILDKDFPGRGYSMANSLLAGASENMTSAQHGYRLTDLAEIVRNDSAALRYFTAENFDPSAFRDAIPEDSVFMKEFEEFLKEFGHRGVYESEIMNPRWSEDPRYLLENIRAQVMSLGNPDYREARAAKKKAVEEEIAGKFKWGLRRLKLNMWTAQAVKGAQMREMSRSVLVKTVEPSRSLFQDIGRRMVERGILEKQADVYHCSLPEIIAILGEYCDGKGLKLLISERKDRWEELSKLEPPDVIIDETPQPLLRSPEAHGRVLKGLGVAAGRACGLARIVHHPGENTKLRTGDVLVAPSTDPGWTPLFLRAKALVMEVGGYTSHGAIVAREYGIPAVVNVPGVMKTLKDGEQLTVDGDEGKVYRG
ncbi:Phosphoenolpyruvate synthase [uncultured archaeon]|nr:Phosphoenolpyruvate synthase [uncultured archaeon]